MTSLGDAFASRPTEKTEASLLAIVEMNLEEYPAFRLGRRSKRPELRYVRARADAEGRTIEQLWVVRGAEGIGLPGPFEQDLYVALLVLFTEQGLPADGRIRFTRNRIAQIMDISNSGRGYELIQQGLHRLAGASVHSEHSFYRPGSLISGRRPASGERRPSVQRGGPAERLSLDFHILEEVRVYERSTPLFVEDGVLAERVDRARPFELSVARLGLPLVQSYERRYTKSLDAGFYFALKSPLAKRLYRYVDKVRNGRGSFEIGLRALGDVLGLEYRYPSDIKNGLIDAHQELRERAYLTGAHFAPLAGGPNAGAKVVYAFNATFDRRTKKRLSSPSTASTAPVAETLDESRADPPLQLALEAFGVSAKRAAALVKQFPEEHIAARLEYVRARGNDEKAAPLRNPAGYLARAIEDGFSVKEPTPVLKQSMNPALRIMPAPVPEPTADVPIAEPAGAWGQLAERLRAKLSGATYAAFVAPALLAAPTVPAETRSLTLPLLSAFAYEKWHRAPIKKALAEAAGELGISVILEATTGT